MTNNYETNALNANPAAIRCTVDDFCAAVFHCDRTAREIPANGLHRAAWLQPEARELRDMLFARVTPAGTIGGRTYEFGDERTTITSGQKKADAAFSVDAYLKEIGRPDSTKEISALRQWTESIRESEYGFHIPLLYTAVGAVLGFAFGRLAGLEWGAWAAGVVAALIARQISFVCRRKFLMRPYGNLDAHPENYPEIRRRILEAAQSAECTTPVMERLATYVREYARPKDIFGRPKDPARIILENMATNWSGRTDN